jgi:hypothetical protein
VQGRGQGLELAHNVPGFGLRKGWRLSRCKWVHNLGAFGWQKARSRYKADGYVVAISSNDFARCFQPVELNDQFDVFGTLMEPVTLSYQRGRVPCRCVSLISIV